ncbi:MAG TPA: L,D-transpeptidase family protein [Nocardioidaceae bacterium]
MKKLLGVLGVTALCAGLGSAVPAPAEATPANATASVLTGSSASPSSAVAAQAAPRHRFTMLDPFARETVHRGMSDQGVHKIAHVRELQYRLRWVGVFHVDVTGTFGDITKAAVKRYQKREGLQVSGVATHATWAHLLRDTIRHASRIPKVCRHKGWHICYDRSMHQVVLLHNGEFRNTWLVRGGASDTPTRLGTHRVYYRDIDHKSQTFNGSPMPYSQFFDGGEALHGSGFMTDPFVDHSHGCINMYIEDARLLWRMTHDKRLIVTVYGAWD